MQKSVLVDWNSKLLLYKQILNSVKPSHIQIWGCASISNIKVIQQQRNNILRNIADAPLSAVTRDLGMEYAKNHKQRLIRYTRNIEEY